MLLHLTSPALAGFALRYARGFRISALVHAREPSFVMSASPWAMTPSATTEPTCGGASGRLGVPRFAGFALPPQGRPAGDHRTSDGLASCDVLVPAVSCTTGAGGRLHPLLNRPARQAEIVPKSTGRLRFVGPCPTSANDGGPRGGAAGRKTQPNGKHIGSEHFRRPVVFLEGTPEARRRERAPPPRAGLTATTLLPNDKPATQLHTRA